MLSFQSFDARFLERVCFMSYIFTGILFYFNSKHTIGNFETELSNLPKNKQNSYPSYCRTSQCDEHAKTSGTGSPLRPKVGWIQPEDQYCSAEVSKDEARLDPRASGVLPDMREPDPPP